MGREWGTFEYKAFHCHFILHLILMRMGNSLHGIRRGFQIMCALHSLLKTLEDFIAGRLISTADMITVQLDNTSTSKEQMLYTFLC